ncbi:ubiquitin-like-conjugating enzyme ATG10 isoform X2 [Syngnathoides biaculeatus]|uniref:ubiquitin-like-conjugating enzyme ATG10 isoform X2 n=1 Tax=Syngnathoides biaculeatus TaxID=300417 RepID=UPI002ADE092E|nr:ubiquitin-like-conjugating enzyme ATG10 isoform X2 [Syngnathoides biaculeatus]XP_061694382.1 ubiquitin-like-conjugating enzyme ATG10 isoform X2 [Syngnathoides biaculeatus]XP_061694383.1 ubiquitin-like-conjugating enzyme ATG10 isoform X2 [Syngnathoides biaculeatus]
MVKRELPRSHHLRHSFHAEMSSFLQGEKNFRRCCQTLLMISDQLGDGWTWESIQGSEECYMKKTALRSVFINSSPTWNDDSFCSDSEGAAADKMDVYGTNDDCDHDWEDLISGCRSHVLFYEYHILYSCSYMAPVLYFRASTLEGRSLSLDEVWSSVHPNFRLRLQHSPLTTITQQEHPLLGQPFFMLHPCRTEEFMRPVLQLGKGKQRQVNYILTWLSVVGPLVGLDISLKYSTLQPQLTEPETALQHSSPS